jgi:hypothetical protein
MSGIEGITDVQSTGNREIEKQQSVKISRLSVVKPFGMLS